MVFILVAQTAREIEAKRLLRRNPAQGFLTQIIHAVELALTSF
jgi:hypothetical protein